MAIATKFEINAGQTARFREQGFLILDRLVDSKTVARLHTRFEKLFNGEFETGVTPDEVNWQAGSGDETLTRQICNGWRADRAIAETVLREDFVGALPIRGAEPGDQLANAFRTCAVDHALHDRRADHHAVAVSRRLDRLGGCAHPDADEHRNVGHGLQAGGDLDRAGRQLGPDPCHAQESYAVDEAPGTSTDPGKAVVGGGGCGEQDRLHANVGGDLQPGLGLLQGKVGQDAA